MNFKDRIEPFLITDDLIVQEFVVQALHDYPNVSKSWVEKLVREAMENKEKSSSILIYLSIDPMHEEIVEHLVEGARNAPSNMRNLYFQLIADLDPELALKHKEELKTFIPSDYWPLYEVLVNGTEEEVWLLIEDIAKKLEAETYLNSNLYIKAKKVAYTLVKKGWVTEAQLDKVVQENLKDKWFSYKGILAVYMIGLMKNDKRIETLAPLLVRDEDILLEEVAAALISFQTDEVVEAIAPYLLKEESNIFAASIIENIKTDYAVEVLRNAYRQVEDEDSQAIIIEALVHQLSPAAEPEISQYVSERPTSFLIEVEQLAYSYYKIIGLDHPFMEEWKLKITKPDQSIKTEKVGRNEPCPCGSGKKYKKCCG
jgi:uncharacterized protein (DUF433 family)